MLPPGPGHPFGTDAIGRDILARVAFGARSSLVLGLVATGVALAAAAVLGSIAATAGKATSEVLMRILDIVMSFPGIALAAVFVAVFGNALPVLIFAIAFLYTPQLTRVVRANVLAQFGEDYVSASRVMGARTSLTPSSSRRRCRSSTRASSPRTPAGATSSPTANSYSCRAIGGRRSSPA